MNERSTDSGATAILARDTKSPGSGAPSPSGLARKRVNGTGIRVGRLPKAEDASCG